MRKIHRSLIAILLSVFTAWGCAQRDEQKMLEESSPESVTLEVSLGGSSRAERFLGTYDQIERLALDIVRNYGNKQVVSDEELVYDDTSGKWTGTIDKLIVDFDYTITGHAYRLYDDPSDNWTTWQKYNHDNGSVYVEIFTGKDQHTVNEGINQLTLRMAPILDERELSVPRITRITRPFQMEKLSRDNITVVVDTVKKEGSSAKDDELRFRFRAVDNLTLPVEDGSRGSFVPASGYRDYDTNLDSYGNLIGYQPIETKYTAPDNTSQCFQEGTSLGQCPQKLQVRVSNLQEIGVTAHFTVYITDNESASTAIDTNPVIESLTAERIGLNQLLWTIYVSDDDPFDELDVSWEYLFGDNRTFSDNTTDKLTDHSGRMQTVMQYEDSDDGMLLVTVCETDQADWTTRGCVYQNVGSTSMEYDLIPDAYHEIIICDDTGCELPNWFAGSMNNPTTWYACRSSGPNDKLDGIQTHDVLDQWDFTKKGFEYIQNGYSSDNGSCSGNLDWIQRYAGRAEQDNGSAFPYPTTEVYDNATRDNLSVYQLLLSGFSAEMTLYETAMIDGFNTNQTCGYSANDWGDNITLDIVGCDDVDAPDDNTSHRMIIYFNLDNDTLRMGHQDNETDNTYPDKLDCLVYGKDSSVFHPHVGNCNDGGGGSGNQTSGTYVTWTDPSDNATGLNASSIDNITVSFSQPMNSGSFWINNSGGCEGTFQLSSDNFSSCVPLNTWSGSGQTYFFTPTADLSSSNHYRIKVDNATSVNGDSVYYTSPEPGFEVSGGSSNNTSWAGTQQLGTSYDDYAHGVATDSSGNVYVTGYTSGGLDGNSSAGNRDLFVVKYNSSGTKLWTKQLGTSSDDRAYGVATDSSGNVYVTGYTGGGLGGNSSAGDYDLFVVKYNSSGTKQWTQQLGTSSGDYAQGVATDSSGNVYVAGYTQGGLDGNSNAGTEDLIVVKYNSSGTKQWTKQLGTSTSDTATGVATDSSGNVYVRGNTNGGLDGNTSAGGSDFFVVKYNSSGTKQWTKQLGTSSSDHANGVATDSSGNVYVAGRTSGGLDGNSNAGNNDLIVVKYNSSGTKQWTKQLGTSSSDEPTGVATDSSGNVYVTGYTEGGLDGSSNAGNYDLFVVKYDSDGNKQ